MLFAAAPAHPASCITCHPVQVERHQKSPHANALARVDEATLRLWRPVRERTGIRIDYPAVGVVEASREGASLRASLEWIFGTGRKARTLVGRHEGGYFEHRLSWYREGDRLGLTPGHPPRPAESLVEALGVPQNPTTMERCFGCHTTNLKVTGGGAQFTFTPGVQCERCHGDGEAHSLDASPRSILTFKNLSAKSSVQFCAGCHRLPDREYNSATPEVEDPLSVRFQPVGLTASQCFVKSGKLSCTTCHDPHTEMKPASDASYRQACVGCHAATAAPVRSRCDRRANAQAACVSCHMQRSSPVPNLTFTDHRIRVYQR